MSDPLFLTREEIAELSGKKTRVGDPVVTRAAVLGQKEAKWQTIAACIRDCGSYSG